MSSRERPLLIRVGGSAVDHHVLRLDDPERDASLREEVVDLRHGLGEHVRQGVLHGRERVPQGPGRRVEEAPEGGSGALHRGGFREHQAVVGERGGQAEDLDAGHLGAAGGDAAASRRGPRRDR